MFKFAMVQFKLLLYTVDKNVTELYKFNSYCMFRDPLSGGILTVLFRNKRYRRNTRKYIKRQQNLDRYIMTYVPTCIYYV